MQIIFVCAEYPINDRPTGGFGSYVKNLAGSLSKLGHLVTILCQGKEKKIIFEGNIEIRVVPVLVTTSIEIDDSLIKKAVLRFLLFLQYPFWFCVQVYQELVQLNASRTVDIIEGGDFGAELFLYLLLRGSTKPTVLIKLHTPSFLIRETNQEEKTIFYRILEKMEKFCVTKADAIYSPSRSLARIIYTRFNCKVATVIPYPVIVNTKKVINLSQSQTVLFVGKIQRKKGVFVLADAIEQVLQKFPKIKFLFVGPDTFEAQVSTTQRLRKKLKKYLKQVSFLPPLSQLQVARYYRKALMTVVPSLWENYPNVILEAVMHGSPVIASDTGGIPELITNRKTGFLVPPNNSQKLAQAIIQLIQKKKLRIMLTRAAQKYLEQKLEPQKIALRTLKFYSSFS